jgi:iron complex transport system substrate-binding protein
MRIVSTLASATEIACALGLTDSIVGISHECDYPTAALDRPRISRPRFDPEGMSSADVDRAVRSAMAEHGSVYEIDAQALERLRPDLILTQAVCEVCAVPTLGVRRVLADLGLDARVLSLDAHTVAEIISSIADVGEATGRDGAALELTRGLEARLAAVRDAVRGAQPPRVLAIEWLDPPFAPGHWVPEMVEMAGGIDLLGKTGERSYEIAWERMRDLDPDALVVMPCGYGLAAARADADLYANELRSVASRAIESDASWVVDASAYFNRSGPRVVRGVEILAGLFHPERWPPPEPDVASAWAPPVGSPSAG